MTTEKDTPDNNMDRRSFVIKAVATTGFALAVLPIAHSTISTDLEGIEASEVKIPVGKDKIPAYQALPKGNGDFPVLVICHEIFGVHEHIKDVCRRFAKLGFYTIAPDLYFRQGDVTKLKEISEIFSKVVSKVTVKQVNNDLDATVKFVKASKKANAKKINVTGFCWGGKAAWLYAAHNPSVSSAIAWYGALVGEAGKKTSEMPIDISATLKVPVLGLYGGKDNHISLESVEQMKKALEKGKSGSKIIIYPEAEHGFFADYRPSYNKEAADAAQKELLNWIKNHGGS